MATRSVLDGYGLQIATEPEIQENLENSFKASFGENIKLTSTSVFGMLIQLLSLTIAEINELLELVANSQDPNGASGRFLSELVLLNGLQRQAGSYTKAVVTLTATAATTVPSGTILADSNGIQWTTDSDVIFSGAGDQTVAVTCLTIGPITLAEDTLTVIVNPVYGLDSVNNSAAATDIGQVEESDASLRLRRQVAAERGGSTTSSALFAAVSDIDGIEQTKIVVNATNEMDSDGVPPHSVWIIVDGISATNEQEFAEAIFNHQASGIGLTGSESISYADPITGDTYTIKYSPVDEVTVYIDINLTITDASVYDADLVRAAIEDFFADLTIGDIVYY